MTLLAKILTVSDGVAAGEREDLAGPLLARILVDAQYEVVEHRLVPDGVEPVSAALFDMTAGFAGLVVTTGGTGFAPRDQTPEGTMLVLEREAPGFGELMRATNPRGALSRARAGTVGECLVVNTPGSPTGAGECLTALLPLLAHAVRLLVDARDPHPPDTGGSIATSSEG